MAKQLQDAYIVAASRTPIGKAPRGMFKNTRPYELLVHAIRSAVAQVPGLDWIELNEAFAAQSLAVIQDLGLDPSKINPLGGAIALGHPLGATGAIRASTVVHGLRRRNYKYGMVTMCVGTGMGAAGHHRASCKSGLAPSNERFAGLTGLRTVFYFLLSQQEYEEMTMDILVERADGVLTIAFNRADKKNAITAAMYQTMADALVEAQGDASVRAILILGSAGIFSAGNDLEDFMKTPPMGEDARVFQFLRAISSAEKPVVASVAGPAVGIGTTMLLHCDLVYAADSASFSLPFAQLGLCPEAASSLLLQRVGGYQAAAEKLLLGEAFDAAEAQRMGFVNRVVPAADVDAFAATQAVKLAALPASSLRVTKSLMKRASHQELQTQMSEEAVHFGKMLLAPEAREAFKAFFEMRKPNFRQFD